MKGKSKSKKLKASLGSYPGYTGDLNVLGDINVSFNRAGALTFKFDIAGVEPSCVDCGVHIHSGTTCTTADEVGGHYWNDSLVPDPWVSSFGSVYNSNGDGVAAGEFAVDSGYGFEDNDGHAVVVHAQSGMRVGCGVLTSKSSKSGKKRARH